MSTTTAIPKSRYLQSLNNIDLSNRNKKVITTPTRPASVSQASKDASVVVSKAKPSLIETAPVVSTRVKRIYDKEFLLKFKYAFTDFPPGVPTPDQLVAQYNADMETRENKEHQAMLESSSLAVKPLAPEKQSIPTGKTSDKAKEKRVANIGGLRLRVPGSSVSRLPMFSPKADNVQVPVSRVAITADDKENSPRISAFNVPLMTTLVKKQRVNSGSLLTAQPTSPAYIIESKKPYAAVVSPLAALKPEFVSSIAKPVEVSPEKAVEDSLDEIAKKMNSVLREEDPRRLAQRQKQIDYGKNTVGYANYIESVAKSKRRREDPKTPNKHQICSKRSWDGQIRKWRRQLHTYDPKGLDFDDSEMLDADDAKGDADVLAPERDAAVPVPVETAVY